MDAWRSRPGGFTLVELVVVIALLGILAAGTTLYLRHTVEAYVDTARRDQLASTTRIAAERLARELRNAVPNTVRVNGPGDCIEFMPLAASGIYQDRAVVYAGGAPSAPLPVTGYTAAAASTFDAFDLGFTAAAGTPYHAVVYPLHADEAYAPTAAGAAGPVLPFAGTSPAAAGTRVQLAANYLFMRHSPQRRVFIGTDPVSFCVTGGRLLRYSGYGRLATQPAPGGFAVTGGLVAENVRTIDQGSPVRVFTLTAGTLHRNAIVKLDLRVSDDGEWVRLGHEVQLRNVP